MNEHERWPMSDDGDIEAWLTDRLGRHPRPDRDTVLRRTLERLPAEPQKRGRWRLASRLKARFAGRREAAAQRLSSSRVRMMSAASGLVVVLAIVSLAAVVLQSVASTTHDVFPGASPDETPGPETAAYFTGTMSPGLPSSSGERTIVGDLGPGHGVALRRGVIETATVRASDHRFEGELSMEVNDERYGSAAAVGTIWGRHRIENDEGAWHGTFVGSGTSETSGVTWHARVMGRYVGEDAFEGLAAIVFFDLSNDSLEGVIVPEALAPPLIAEQAGAGRLGETTPDSEGADR